MLKDITIGQHYPTESIIHKLDSRVKLVATFIFMVSLFIINKFWPYLIVILSLLAIIKLSNIPFKYILLAGRRAYMVVWIFKSNSRRYKSGYIYGY